MGREDRDETTIRLPKERELRGTVTPAAAVVTAAVSGWYTHLKRRCVKPKTLFRRTG